MAQEIERTFLVDPTRLAAVIATATDSNAIVQGYLSTEPVVRVRRKGERAYLTVKGPGLVERAEFEYAIPPEDVPALLGLCPRPPIEKVRYDVPYGDRTWEIDVFSGANAGLILAEVELPSQNAALDLPPWAGPEVTTDPRYTNAALASHPYGEWAQQPHR